MDIGEEAKVVRAWNLSAIDLSQIGTLTVAELGRADSLATSLARERFLAGRLAMRELIAEELGIDPRDVQARFRCARCGPREHVDHGQPRYMVTGEVVPLGVSYSRCGAWCVGIVSRSGSDIGIDIEDSTRSAFSSVGFEDVFATRRERRRLARCSRHRRPRHRAQLWARKESALKATGDGLRVDPCTLDTGSPGKPALVDGPAGAGHPAQIRLLDLSVESLRLPPEYVVSTATVVRRELGPAGRGAIGDKPRR